MLRREPTGGMLYHAYAKSIENSDANLRNKMAANYLQSCNIPTEKSCTNISTISTFFLCHIQMGLKRPAVLTQTSSVQPVMLHSIEPIVIDRNITLTAEIYWVLKVVSSHYSLKSSESIKGVFQLMFPDSGVAKQFSCVRRSVHI